WRGVTTSWQTARCSKVSLETFPLRAAGSLDERLPSRTGPTPRKSTSQRRSLEVRWVVIHLPSPSSTLPPPVLHPVGGFVDNLCAPEPLSATIFVNAVALG